MTSLKFSCPPELREQVKALAAKEDRSESAIIRRALRAYLETEASK